MEGGGCDDLIENDNKYWRVDVGVSQLGKPEVAEGTRLC